MSSHLTDLRDETYARLLLKKNANEFSFNNFGVKKTWKPSTDPKEMNTTYSAGGLVTVVAGLFGDRVAIDRDNLVVGEYSVKIGYQKYIVTDVASVDTAPIDGLIDFIEELDTMCRHEIILDNVAYIRTEFEKDESGLPFHFVRISETSTFEAYFDAFFQIPLP
jgi:hypothetical protein